MENVPRGLHALPARTRGIVSATAVAAAGFGALHLFGREGDPRAVLLAGGVLLAAWAASGVRASMRILAALLAVLWGAAFYWQAMRLDAAPDMLFKAAGAALAVLMLLALLAEMWALRLLTCAGMCGGGGCESGGGGCGSGGNGGLSAEEKRAVLDSLKAGTPPGGG